MDEDKIARADHRLEGGNVVAGALRNDLGQRLEDRLEPADVAVALGRGGIQLGQFGAGPEPLLELLGLARDLAAIAGIARIEVGEAADAETPDRFALGAGT